ncbi:ABC transporter C family member 10-like [Cucurbita pepo subsp. pepo]|uniref:ABC transporter C family member 10-like n=1 Tax=Cucurbita pepo subsp. pepo TaxID=3664 RepID=UPI000C9D82EB|nr:ABC transporter C family member 10-like [Cucurbita pepo subsp. pepo]
MEDIWGAFCGGYDCSSGTDRPCGFDYGFLSHSSSCITQALIISFDFLLLILLLSNIVGKSMKRVHMSNRIRGGSGLRSLSAIFNGCVGLVYLSLGIWSLVEKLRKDHSALPLQLWLSASFHGFTWLLVSSIISCWSKQLPRPFLRLLSIVAFMFAGIICILSLFDAVSSKMVSAKMVLDVLSVLGSVLLLFCCFGSFSLQDSEESINGNGLYTPLNGEANESGKLDPVTPLAKAGLLGKISFWWMNPLMKRGKKKTLNCEDIPMMREADRAESCYLQFVNQMNEHKRREQSSQPSVLKVILSCHRRDIFLSGFFALLKILFISAGPLLLNAFILVAQGHQSFKYEGLVLAISLFFSKSIESISQRQWYFRARLVGLKVRSLLSAAIYKKQLRLSNEAKLMHSSGEIMNYVTVDAYRIGEFSFWFHQTWTTSVQLCIALLILYKAVGIAAIASFIVIVLCVVGNTPIAKLQHKFQSKLMAAQDERLKTFTEALVNMKVLKLYAWETHFKNVIEKLRKEEHRWLSAVQYRKGYNGILFWSSPVIVSIATFGACSFLNIPLHANNVFTFVSALRLVQEPVRSMGDVIAAIIQARVSFTRIVNFLEAPELQSSSVCRKQTKMNDDCSIRISSASFSWEESSMKPTLHNINLEVRPGSKLAICGEVGSGKSTLLAAILGEIPNVEGNIEVHGRIAYVSQSAWIQTGSIRDNILFGSEMENWRYQETLEKCSLVKDLELLPYGDLTEIGERGVNLSGGQKQRIQLARALYQNADIYLLDDPFSAVDAHTATSLFNGYVVEALSGKTVLLVTHQVDFLPAFDSVLLMSDGEILEAGPYDQLLAHSKEFQDLVNAHKETAGTERLADFSAIKSLRTSCKEIKTSYTEKLSVAASDDANQLIKQEEREVGDSGFKPYIQYLNQNKGFLFFSLDVLSHLAFVACGITQNSWMASNIDSPNVSNTRLIVVYLLIGVSSISFLVARSVLTALLGLQSSKSLFSQLLTSLFRSPMSFYDSTPLGRILSRVSMDLSIVDLDVPFSLIFAVGATANAYAALGVLAVITWQVLFISIPTIVLAICLQRYYFASAKELMRLNGTTKSIVANHLSESIAGAVTIRAFAEEERFFKKNLEFVDGNASPFFHNFSANEWLIQRLEMLSAVVLASAAFCIVLLPTGSFSPGFIGMALSYGLSLNVSLVFSIQNQCNLANHIISVERLNQYMHLSSEAPEIIEENRPPTNWPSVGKVEIIDLKIRYRPNSPLVLHGISCTFEGGHKIGIVGRTGSGKSTLLSAIFRLVEPAGGKILVDGIDICSIGLHDLRSRFGIIPQDPTLFKGTVRYNLDPLVQHSDDEIWEVLGKCQLREAVEEKEAGLDSLVVEDGSNWSMGQRQLFCLGRALLRRSRILVLDEATASIDNATDMILQKTIRSEFADCTVITVAHRIPTVMDCTMVLAISDGRIAEYDEPSTLIKREGSLFGQLVKEYWSHSPSAE